jgi:hypothetical protein
MLYVKSDNDVALAADGNERRQKTQSIQSLQKQDKANSLYTRST